MLRDVPITNASSHGSPPDDAGHRGAFTRPEETLIEPTTGEDDVPPPPADEVPLFQELRLAGMTEWLGRVFPFGELAPQVGGPADPERLGELWLVCSFTTDRPGGWVTAGGWSAAAN